MEKRTDLARILIGWKEWMGLPDLTIPHIKVKIDTGARTSSLHAFKIQTYTERGHPFVRFLVHPLQRRLDIVIQCESPIIDHRIVSDSGGHRERRYVITTHLMMAGQTWPIEVTLANRETMSFRMLLGRTAIRPLLIDPSKAFMLGKPEAILQTYKKLRKSK